LSLPSARAQQTPPDFRLDFDGCPPRTVFSPPGEVMTFEIFSTLTTSRNTTPWGTGAWNLSLEVSGATLETFEVKGLIVDAIFDEEVEPFPHIVHHDHYPVDLGTCWVSIARFATFDGDPSRKGAISSIYLEPAPGRANLQPNGVVRIARMVVSVRVPEDERENQVVIR